MIDLKVVGRGRLAPFELCHWSFSVRSFWGWHGNRNCKGSAVSCGRYFVGMEDWFSLLLVFYNVLIYVALSFWNLVLPVFFSHSIFVLFGFCGFVGIENFSVVSRFVKRMLRVMIFIWMWPLPANERRVPCPLNGLVDKGAGGGTGGGEEVWRKVVCQ